MTVTVTKRMVTWEMLVSSVVEPVVSLSPGRRLACSVLDFFFGGISNHHRITAKSKNSLDAALTRPIDEGPVIARKRVLDLRSVRLSPTDIAGNELYSPTAINLVYLIA